MKLIEIRIESRDGAPTIAGLRYVPDVSAKPIGVILAHGFTSGKYSMDSAAAYLAERGYECVTFDAVGHKLGCTGGRMGHISEAAENLIDTVNWLRSNSDIAGVTIIGHSMGAAAAIQAVAWDSVKPDSEKPLRGIACLCMGVNPTAGFDTPLGASMLRMRSDYVNGAPAKELLSGLNGMLDSAATVRVPTLLIAARNDVLLPVASVQMLGEQMGDNAEVRVVDAMHLDAPDRSRGLLFNWLEKLSF